MQGSHLVYAYYLVKTDTNIRGRDLGSSYSAIGSYDSARQRTELLDNEATNACYCLLQPHRPLMNRLLGDNNKSHKMPMAWPHPRQRL